MGNGPALESGIADIAGSNERTRAAMESLAESMPRQAATPRFEDGSINLRELMRRLAEDVVNAIMGAEADQLRAGGANSRNGCREHNLVTCVGGITLRMPKLRTGSFFPEDVAEKLGISGLSKDQVGAMAQNLDADVAELLGRDLGGSRTPYLWLDAAYVKRRRDGRAASTAVVTAIGRGEGADAAEEAEPGALAYLAVPPSHWKRLRTSNLRERASREIKRRSRVVQVFPSERSLEHLVGAVMCELDEQWSESRCFACGKIQELYDKRRADEAAPERPAVKLEEAARKMIVASMELAEKAGGGVAWPVRFHDSGEGPNPRPSRIAARSGCLRQHLDGTAYTNFSGTTHLSVRIFVSIPIRAMKTVSNTILIQSDPCFSDRPNQLYLNCNGVDIPTASMKCA